ncbi:MAG: hypothetical protein HQL64_13240 [Magnetococcales bacterium]|nr:hypothetical protein [Magnetococcales bacterium]
MKKFLVLFLTGSLLVALSPVEAGKKKDSGNIDFGKFTCADFVESVNSGSEEDIGAMLLWLDGYLSGVSGDTVLNWKTFESFSENIASYCVANEQANLLAAAKKVGLQR